MAVGPMVRRLFGPFERSIANVYRRIFIDLDDWMDQVAVWVPEARRILEVGCGEGAMTERLSAHYRAAQIVAIDVTPRLGRLYNGDTSRVIFRQVPVERIAEEQPASFDFVILSDVVHHVPLALRKSLMLGIRDVVAPGGSFVFKEWVRTSTPIHWACVASDRFLTGDDVAYLDAAGAGALLDGTFGPNRVLDSAEIRPWRNNLAMLLRPDA